MSFIRNLLGGFGIVGAIFAFILTVLASIGWVMNILAIIAAASGPLTTLLVIRIIGVFAAPLGAILGWC